MSTQRVIRINRSGNGFVLVGISPRGPKSLDLNLLGTENEQAYFMTLFHDQIGGLKAKTDNFTDAAWHATVSWVLLQEKPPKAYQQLVETVYVVASIEAKKGIVLTFRQNIEGLTPRIGSITLKEDENQELDLFEWAGILSDTATNAEQRASKIQSQYDAQKETVDKLNAQLEEFIQAKKRQEDEMLEKFRQLLNTKKLKIRDQQRLLAGAKIDHKAAQAVHKARKTYTEGKESPSRRSKRKANGAVDQEMADDDRVQEETESEDDFEDAQSPQRSASEASETQQILADRAVSQGRRDKPGESNERSTENTELPPRRELPFANKASVPGASKQVDPQVIDDDETDDEL